MAILQINNLTKKINEQVAVDNIRITIEAGKQIAIAGETGAGKSTLLKMIAGLIQPDSGTIVFENKKLLGPYEKLIAGHPTIAYLSQHYELRNNYYVYELLDMANEMPIADATKLYSICKIEHLLKRKTNQLSGGEKQRVALARLLSTAPKLLLLDEPFSNLDVGNKLIMQQIVADYKNEFGITCIKASHQPDEILSWADSVLIFQQGKIIQQAMPYEIYHQPINKYAAQLLGRYNLLDAQFCATLFEGLQVEKGKQLLVRPEQFYVATSSANALMGIVYAVNFMGHFYLYQIKVKDTIIEMYSNNNAYEVNQSILVHCNIEIPHFL